MTDLRQAIDDLIDAADILVHRRDAVTEYVAILPMSSVRRLERALEQAQKVIAKEWLPATYLASPYSHSDPAVRESRYLNACKAAARLTRLGHFVYSPIVHSHPLSLQGLPTDWRYWRERDLVMLSRCQELVVLTLSGWEESKGVQAEIQFAEEFGIPVRYTELGRLEVSDTP